MPRLIAAMLAACLLAGTAVAAEPPPVENYTRPPGISNVRVSPSGKRLALLMGGADGRSRLATLTLEPLGKPRVVGGFSNLDIRTVRWVNDDRLVYEAYEANAAEIREGFAGTFAVDFDGSNQRQLIAWVTAINTTSSGVISRVLPYGWFVDSTLDDGSDDILVVQSRRDSRGEPEGVRPARLNTRTGELNNLAHGMPQGTSSFWTDASHAPRVLVAVREGRDQVHWRAGPEAPWTQVADFDSLADPSLWPWHVDADGTLIVIASRNGYRGLYRFDPATKRLNSDPLVAIGGYDLDPVAEIDSRSGRLLGMHFEADRPMTYWFDEGLQRVQRGIDAALPGRMNRLYCGRCESTRWFVVRSRSDRQPGEYLLFDRQKSVLQSIGAARPWIDESTQGRRTAHRVKTRDGLDMPLYVTHPAGAPDDGPLPTVVLVHGGPWSRGGSLAWSAEAQFLASRGYRVLEPEFRGSTGYGWEHFHAGWKAWGGAMQDDLVDAIEWAAARKWTDRTKVCIVGASYGGYAALMAPIVHPQAFRCAVALAAVTDIALMYDITWSDTSDAARRYGMPRLVGDREKDAAMLERASPLKRAAELKVPVLLAYGLADRRVPPEHAQRFAAAAERGGVALEKVGYPSEGHGWFDPANHADYERRVERFLAQALKAAP